MNLTFSLGVYFILWWLVFIAVIPLGVRTLEEEGEDHHGAPSAPVHPRLWLKMGLATVISAAIWLAIFSVFEFKLFTLDDIPLIPRFEDTNR